MEIKKIYLKHMTSYSLDYSIYFPWWLIPWPGYLTQSVSGQPNANATLTVYQRVDGMHKLFHTASFPERILFFSVLYNVILATHADPAQATSNLQHHLNLIQAWIHKWKIKINKTKFFPNELHAQREQCPQVRLNNNNIPQSPSAKYLGIHLDSRLTWKNHVTKTRKQIRLKTKELNWLIGRISNLPLTLQRGFTSLWRPGI
jgi:hypothetical protein